MKKTVEIGGYAEGAKWIVYIDCIFLDPHAWQAVGKVEGWKDKTEWKYHGIGISTWHFKMHRMIDALAKGRTLEESLQDM